MVKIITWNVNSIKMRLERAKRLLENEKPDILCLQELKCVDDAFPKDFEALGYTATVFGQKTYNGVAILSKTQPSHIQRGITSSDPDSRLVSVQIGNLIAYSAYIPNGQAVGSDKYVYKLSWLEKLESLLKSRHTSDEYVVVTGDFNVAPEDKDVHDPIQWKDQILCSVDERKAFQKVIALGYTDCFRKLHPDSNEYSWWDYRNLGFPMNNGLRIDFLLANQKLAEKCVSSTILREERKGEKPSDHAPVCAEFDI